MANKDAAFGLKPVRMMGGAPYSGGQSRYRIASGATTPIYQGDLVTQLTAGVLGRHAASGTVPIVGVFNGVSYTDPTTGEQVFKNYYPGSISASDIIASVIDDPNVVFEVQADDTFPVADLFGNFDIDNFMHARHYRAVAIVNLVVFMLVVPAVVVAVVPSRSRRRPWR